MLRSNQAKSKENKSTVNAPVRSSTGQMRLLSPRLTTAPQANSAIDSLQIRLDHYELEYKKCCVVSDNKLLWRLLSDAEKMANERAKLKLLQEVNKLIDQYYGATHNIEVIDDAPRGQNVPLSRKLLFAFLIVVDITFMSIGSYLGSVALLNLFVPAISTLVATLVAGIATAIEAVMMYSVFKPMLQRGLKIPVDQPEGLLATDYGKRLSMMQKINAKMVNNIQYTQKHGPNVYASFMPLLKLLNQDVKKITLLPYQEPYYKTLARYGLSILNVTLSIAGTYYGASLLLLALCAPLVGTPIGWGIIGTFIFAQLLTRLVIRQTAVYDLLNPFAKRHESLRNKIESFVNPSEAIDREWKMNATLREAYKNQIKHQLFQPRVAAGSTECPAFFKPGEVSLLAESDLSSQPRRHSVS